MRGKIIVGGIVVLCAFSSYAETTRKQERLALAAQYNSEGAASPNVARRIDGNTVAYSTKNEALADARKMGRQTLPRFGELLKSGMDGKYTIKFPLMHNGHVEHIWLQISRIVGDDYIGVLANEPVNGTDYKIGQSMTVTSARRGRCRQR